MGPDPTRKCRRGWGSWGAEGSPELPACRARARDQRHVQLREPLAGFSGWGVSLKGRVWDGSAHWGFSPTMRIWGFPSPLVSSQSRVPGWLRSGMAQLDVCRIATPGKTTLSLCCLFALLSIRFSPSLKTPREPHQPLTAPVRGGQRGRSCRTAPLQR